MKNIIIATFFIFFINSFAYSTPQNKIQQKKTTIYQFEIKEEIGPAIWRKMKKALSEAKDTEASIFLIRMNTYGGTLVAADSMRTAILQSPIPTYVFIDNNAASAGALIALACDSIYMSPGASIGAATVVNQANGEAMPDKYQSYMRAMMRTTAETKGGDTIRQEGKEIIKWRRNPLIAEAMVDDRLAIENIIDSGKTLTFTTNEAILNGYCERKVENIEDIFKNTSSTEYEIKTYQPSVLQNIIGFLVNPILQSILLMIIIGGIWFELQSPGIGFPLLASVTAALLYFMPLLLEGFAEYWEIAIFIIGILFLLAEFFIVPGFGVTGITGLILMIIGLVLSMVGSLDFEFAPADSYRSLLQASFQISISILSLILIGFVFGSTFFRTQAFKKISLNKEMSVEDGFISTYSELRTYIGQQAVVLTDLHPSGSIKIDGKKLDAISISGFIPKGKKVLIKKFEIGQLYVEECL